jgi:hypothetical protein
MVLSNFAKAAAFYEDRFEVPLPGAGRDRRAGTGLRDDGLSGVDQGGLGQRAYLSSAGSMGLHEACDSRILAALQAHR